jgi:hypothetical protein
MSNYKQSISNIFEETDDEPVDKWVMKNIYDESIFIQHEVAKIKEKIKKKFIVEYNPDNPKLKKIMDVRINAFIEKYEELIYQINYNSDWKLTYDDGKLHLIANKEWDGIPLDIKDFTWEVKGTYTCDKSVTSLKGCPDKVGGDFVCVYNEIHSLEGCPKYIGRTLFCQSNQLTSLRGCPDVINKDFDCSNNKLTSLEHGPKSIKGDFNCAANEITQASFKKFFPKVSGAVDITRNPF